MKRVSVCLVAAFMLMPALAEAQTAAYPAPRGHRQPVAADVPNDGGLRTDPQYSGRSARRGTINDLDNASASSPRICANCED